MTTAATPAPVLRVRAGLPLKRVGAVVAFEPDRWDRHIPPQLGVQMLGCATCAAYLAAAALLVPKSHVALGGAGITPTRAGFLDMLRSCGVSTERQHGALSVRSERKPRAARVQSCEDPLLVMAALLPGLIAEGETVVEQGAQALLDTHPGFVEALQALGADIEMQ